MTEWWTYEWVVIALSLGLYVLALWLQKRTGILLLNPTLVTMVLLLAVLQLGLLDYPQLEAGQRSMYFLLKPTIVALGYPLYTFWETIRKQALSILVSQLLGSVVGIVSVVWMARALGAPPEIWISLAPKSATSPIAFEVAASTGGLPSFTAALVLTVGIFGALFGYGILKLLGIRNPQSQSLAIGAAAHGIGTARSMQISPRYGALSTLGMILTGIFTAFLTPLILRLLS